MIRLNRTSVWQVMAIWISRYLPLFNFERLDISCAWIGPPCEKLWPFKFLESIRFSITNVSINYAPESEIRLKSYDQFNISRASIVQFRASRYMIRLNRTSMWKVMTIWISRQLPLFNFERLDILCSLNRTSVWKVMTILISRELPLFNFECLDIWCSWIGPPCENLWPFEFLESSRGSITNVSIYYASESDLRVKSYDHLNFSSASVVQVRASRHLMSLNRTSVCKVMTIWISRELPLFNFERVDILSGWIWHPS